MENPGLPLTDPRDHFSLNRIPFVVERYRPPEGTFDPAGTWVQEYDYVALGYWHFRTQGSLRIARRPIGNGSVSLRFDMDRIGRTGYSHYIVAEMEAHDDALAVPKAWRMEAKIAKSGDDPPYLFSGMRKMGRLEGATLTVVTGGDAESTALPGPCTCKWSLIDVAQRLPREKTERLRFSLIDEFDEVRHNQYITYRTTAMLPLRDGPAKLTAYEHLGEGVIPTVYWVDERGRTLFVVTGVEAFVLRSSCGVPAETGLAAIQGQPLEKLRAKEG